MLGSADILFFEGFRLDCGGLFRLDDAGNPIPVPLGSRALDLLGLLASRQGELISKDEIMATVWPQTVVEENNLTVQIAALRRVLDAGRAQGSCIHNVPGRGYRFVAPVRCADPAVPASALPPGKACGEKEPPLSLDAAGDIGRGSSPAARKRQWRWRSVTFAAAGLLVIAVTAITAPNWHLPWRADGNQAPRLSIVVLPFTNLSDDREQQYFADGITDDLTTDLSRLAGMFVISRDTAFTYKNKQVDAKQIGRELGVRYLLEGSVRRSGNLVRVNAQLIAAESGRHLWAERFDRDMTDILTLQDEITRRTAFAVGSEIVIAEASRPTEHPDALDYFNRARAAFLKPPTRENDAEVVSLFERALALDPRSAEIQSWLARALASRVLDELTDSRKSDIERAEALVEQALAASPHNLSAHHARGGLMRAQGRYEEAIAEYETVISLNRNFAQAYAHLGRTKLLAGSIEEAIPLQEQAIRLSPRDPNIGNWYYRIGLVHLLQSRADEAIFWLKKARNAAPGLLYVPAHLVSAYALKGESELAAAALVETRRLNPDGLYSTIANVKARYPRPAPTVAALYENTFYAGLRKAGVPDE
jgi:TolB-like protein/DNA-binding winged helix-turn-helix (wHTH) protein/Tfp pilus assembly protein PilF